MTTERNDRTDDAPGVGDLDALFAEARGTPPAPSRDLLARIEAEGLARQPRATPVGTRPAAAAPETGRGLFSGLAQAIAGIGGWPALGGLTAALVIGFGLGVSPPDSVESFATELLDGGTSAVLGDALWTFDSTLVEG